MQTTAHQTWNALKGRDIGVYTFEQVDNILFAVLRNGEDAGWQVRYDEVEEGYVCFDDNGEWMNDKAYDTLEEIELALETWDYRIAWHDRVGPGVEAPWAGEPT